MNALPTDLRRLRSGISLLEVLISIGILSIGLLATLALIPAGRSLIRKAEIDNRSAALVPNAFATMGSLGLFRVNAIDWQSNPPEPGPPAARSDTESAGRRDPLFAAPGPDVYDPAQPPSGKDTHVIEARWTTPDPPPTLSGNAPAGKTLWLRRNGQPLGSLTVPANGLWNFTVNPALPSVNMQLAAADPWLPIQSTVFTEHAFSAYWEEEQQDPDDPTKTILVPRDVAVTVTPDSSAAPRLAGDSNAAAYRQYHLRRSQDREVGDTTVALFVNPKQRINEDASNATLLTFPALGETVFQRRLAYVYRSRIRLTGEVWRWQEGTRACRWDRLLDYENRNEYHTQPPTRYPTSHVRYDANVPPNPFIYGYFPGADIDGNPGTVWLDSDGSEKDPQKPDRVIEDTDWFRIDVQAGQTLEVDWSGCPSTYVDRSFKAHGDVSPWSDDVYKFPLYFNAAGEDDALLLPPAGSPGSHRAVYAIPGDGYVLTRIRLQPAKLDVNGNVDRGPGIQVVGDDDYPVRINTVPNPAYSVDMTLYRNDRVVVIDPMMCARLDRILIDHPASDPHARKRRRFAEFQQTFQGTNTQKSFVIPRLNWRLVDPGTPNQTVCDHLIGLADHLCRPQDTLEVDLAQERREGPSLPTFDTVVDGGGNAIPIRRRSTDRMSWLLMLQPEDSGSVPANWQVGKYFHASIVVFEDRLFPVTTDNPPAPVEGEHAFVGQWSFNDGMIEATIPRSLGIADEDIQKMFRTGAWVLLAPRQALPVAPIDDDTLLEWIEIQTSEIKRFPQSTIVRFLPAHEPRQQILRVDSGAASVIVLAYQGVVNVVTRAVRIEE